MPQEAVKYLGVWIDERLSFNTHIKNTAAKATMRVNALNRLLPNMGGAKAGKRRILASVVNSISLYGAEIWGGRLTKANRETLERPQTLIAQRITSAYSTVSKEAKLVLAALTPLAIEAQRRWENFAGEGLTRGEMTLRWQDRWERADTGRATYNLLPDIDAWTSRRHGETDFFLTQFLTGIGLFDYYLHKIGQATSDKCTVCRTTDNAEHCLLQCPLYDDLRRDILWAKNLTLAQTVHQMLEDKNHFDGIKQASRKILQRRRESRTPTQSNGYARAGGASRRQ